MGRYISHWVKAAAYILVHCLIFKLHAKAVFFISFRVEITAVNRREVGRWEGGHGSDTFSLDVICWATIPVLIITNIVAAGPMCGLHNYRKNRSCLEMPKKER